MTSVESAIREAISPLITEANLFLEALQISTAGKHRLIRILVDRLDPQTPLSLDEVTAITKPISERIDSLTELGERPFTLEVSSPGVDFPLTLPRHWAKNVGRLVIVTLKSGEQATGRISSADEEGATIESKKGVAQKVLLAEIAQANIEIEFK